MLEQNYRFVIGNIGSHSSLSDDELLLAQKDIEKLKRKGDELGLTHLINKLLDCDDFGNGASNAGSCYIRNYSEGPLAFVPTQNRIIFWNKEGLTVKVLDYTQHSLTSLAALFSL